MGNAETSTNHGSNNPQPNSSKELTQQIKESATIRSECLQQAISKEMSESSINSTNPSMAESLHDYYSQHSVAKLPDLLQTNKLDSSSKMASDPGETVTCSCTDSYEVQDKENMFKFSQDKHVKEVLLDLLERVAADAYKADSKAKGSRQPFVITNDVGLYKTCTTIAMSHYVDVMLTQVFASAYMEATRLEPPSTNALFENRLSSYMKVDNENSKLIINGAIHMTSNEIHDEEECVAGDKHSIEKKVGPTAASGQICSEMLSIGARNRHSKTVKFTEKIMAAKTSVDEHGGFVKNDKLLEGIYDGDCEGFVKDVLDEVLDAVCVPTDECSDQYHLTGECDFDNVPDGKLSTIVSFKSKEDDFTLLSEDNDQFYLNSSHISSDNLTEVAETITKSVIASSLEIVHVECVTNFVEDLINSVILDIAQKHTSSESQLPNVADGTSNCLNYKNGSKSTTENSDIGCSTDKLTSKSSVLTCQYEDENTILKHSVLDHYLDDADVHDHDVDDNDNADVQDHDVNDADFHHCDVNDADAHNHDLDDAGDHDHDVNGVDPHDHHVDDDDDSDGHDRDVDDVDVYDHDVNEHNLDDIDVCDHDVDNADLISTSLALGGSEENQVNSSSEEFPCSTKNIICQSEDDKRNLNEVIIDCGSFEDKNAEEKSSSTAESNVEYKMKNSNKEGTNDKICPSEGCKIQPQNSNNNLNVDVKEACFLSNDASNDLAIDHHSPNDTHGFEDDRSNPKNGEISDTRGENIVVKHNELLSTVDTCTATSIDDIDFTPHENGSNSVTDIVCDENTMSISVVTEISSPETAIITNGSDDDATNTTIHTSVPVVTMALVDNSIDYNNEYCLNVETEDGSHRDESFQKTTNSFFDHNETITSMNSTEPEGSVVEKGIKDSDENHCKNSCPSDNSSKTSDILTNSDKSLREERLAAKGYQLMKQKQMNENKNSRWKLENDVPPKAASLTNSSSSYNHASHLDQPRSEVNESIGPDASTQELKNALDTLEEKYRQAMVQTAQLDNERSQLQYQVQQLCDVLEEQEDELYRLKGEHKEKCQEVERQKRGYAALQKKYGDMQEALRQRDELIQDLESLQQNNIQTNKDAADLRETVVWKDRKIESLMKQLEIYKKMKYRSIEQGLVVVGEDHSTMVDEDYGKPSIALVSQVAAQVLESAGDGSLDAQLKKLAEEKQTLADQVRSLQLQLEEEQRRVVENGKTGSMHSESGVTEMQLLEIQREAAKQLNEYKLKLQKSDQDLIACHGHISRLESQLQRVKQTSELYEKNEDEMRAEKRKLMRDLRTALDRIEEMEMTNSHLEKRLERIRASRTAVSQT